MKQQRIFVSHAAQHSDDRTWVREFLSGLRMRGFDVFEFAIVAFGGKRADITAGAMGDAVKVADVIVHIINEDPQSIVNFAFEHGVALMLERDIVGVLPPDMDASSVDISPLRPRLVAQQSPAETIEAILAMIRQPQVA
jgi:hypothetical protein